MFEIKVNIEATAPDLSAAITALADAIKGHPGTTSNLVVSPVKLPETLPDVIPAVKTDVVDAPATQQQFMNPPEAPAPASVPVTPVAAPVAPAPVPVPAPAVPTIDLETISRAGAALIDQGKIADVLALLNRYGVQAVNQLDPSQYPAFAEDLKALGASI